MFCSKVLAIFDDHLCLLRFLANSPIDKRDSDGFFSNRIVCRASDRSYNLTDSSLVAVLNQLHFLAIFFDCL